LVFDIRGRTYVLKRIFGPKGVEIIEDGKTA
jgi:hypothetical protein